MAREAGEAALLEEILDSRLCLTVSARFQNLSK